jgi:hypothetical protein
MKTHATRPLVFLAFANDMDDYLVNLKEESRAVFDALRPLEQESAIAVHREESVEVNELYTDLLGFDGQIVLFHYAGHANGKMLQLEGGNGAAGGLAKLLGQQQSLQLVFLNGCATKDQVKLLHAAGVPAVIATSVDINDAKATMLSTAFYAALAKGRSIVEAFESACAFVEAKLDTNSALKFSIKRSPSFNFDVHEQQNPEQNEESLTFEWVLYIREDCEADLAQWRLNDAKKDWTLVLEDSNGPLRNLQNKIVSLEHKMRSRSVDAVRCVTCGSVSAMSHAKSKGVSAHCPVCASKDCIIEQSKSKVPQQKIPFEITESQARIIASSMLTDVEPASLLFHQVYFPFWVFDVDTRTMLKAQRGRIKDVHADELSLVWENIERQIDIQQSGVMIPAFTHRSTNTNDSQDWYWQDSKAEPVKQFSRDTAFLAFCLSEQEAFEQVTGDMSERLEQEISFHIGGQQQKNVSLHTQYKDIGIRSIFLPHWCVSVVSSNQAKTDTQAPIVINGQTGALRVSPSTKQPALANQRHGIMNQTKASNNTVNNTVSHWISIFSGAGIGIMVGLLMGLAAPQDDGAKSVVAIFIGAVGVGLAALLGLNDKHFSAAKGLRIGSFGLAVTVATLSAIYIRDNHLISPSFGERAATLASVLKEIDDDRVIELLRVSKVVEKTDGSVITQSAPVDQALGVLNNATAAQRSTCQVLNVDGYAADDFSATDLSGEFEFNDKDNALGLQHFAKQLNPSLPEQSRKSILLAARDAVCMEVYEGINPIVPQSDDCQSLMASLAMSLPDGQNALRTVFETTNSLQSTLKKIDSTSMSTDEKHYALRSIGSLLCE